MTNALTTQQEPANSRGETIRDRLASPEMMRQMASVLPKHLTAERMARIAIAAITRTPKLAQCTPASVYSAMMTLSQFGLEPNGRDAHLIPFENRKKGTVECQLIIDYKGLVDLAYRSGRVANIHADRICANDEFEQVNGNVTHRRAKLGTPRGEAIGFYAIVTFKDGTTKAEVMDIEEIEAIRARSKSPDEGPWASDPGEMAKKTVFKRLSKWIPLSPEFRDAVTHDNESEARLSGHAAIEIPAPLPQLVAAATPQPEPAPEPARRGRPPGSRNKVNVEFPQEETAPAQPNSRPATKQEEIASLCGQNNITIDEFNSWATDEGMIPAEAPTWDEIPNENAVRIMRVPNAMIDAIKAKRGAQ